MDAARTDGGLIGDVRALDASAGALHSRHRAGEMPGAGRYQCGVCGTRVTIAEASDALGACPYCHGTEFRRVHD